MICCVEKLNYKIMPAGGNSGVIPFCTVTPAGSFIGDSKMRLGTHHSKETKRKMSLALKGRPSEKLGIPRSKEHIRKAIEGRKGYKHSDKTKRKISEGNKGKLGSFLGKHHSEEIKRKISKKAIKRYQNLEYKEKMGKAQFVGRDNSPNKSERRLRKILNKMFPGEYKFVGDGKVWINGKNPDFINVNGQKKIIELFGNFWHGKAYRKIAFNDNSSNKEHRIQRQKIFAEYGYKTLVIWERGLNNIKQLKKKLRNFNF